jgi:CheY-like chemotaxis protein
MTNKASPAEVERRPIILFADDDPDILKLFAVWAEMKGWDYKLARTGREALNIVNSLCHAPEAPDCQMCPLAVTNTQVCVDLIVMDIDFRDHQKEPGPRLTGITVAKSIQEAYGKVPIIFYTAWANTMTKDLARPYGVELIVKSEPDQKTGQGEVEDVIKRVEYWLRFWRASRYEGPERRRSSMTPPDLNMGRRITDRPRIATVPPAIESVLREVRAKEAGR